MEREYDIEGITPSFVLGRCPVCGRRVPEYHLSAAKSSYGNIEWYCAGCESTGYFDAAGLPRPDDDSDIFTNENLKQAFLESSTVSILFGKVLDEPVSIYDEDELDSFAEILAEIIATETDQFDGGDY